MNRTLDPCIEGTPVALLCCFGPLFPREEKVTAHHYKAALSVHLYGGTRKLVSWEIIHSWPVRDHVLTFYFTGCCWWIADTSLPHTGIIFHEI